ncbi:MAG TPA: universal stress protein [Kofleriaceae bacterium]|nr:universal stress protein [Kofleriaceae bacterium]
MTRAKVRRYRIVVGVDLSDYSQIVIEQALDQAARHQSPDLHFIHVAERRKDSIEELSERLSAAVYPSLQVFNQYGTDWRARLHVRRGKPEQQINILAADILADLIVVGQFGLHRRSTANRVLTHAHCATLVVGMPKEVDLSQCHACSATREDSDGALWFCDEHVVGTAAVSPQSVWTNGNGTLMR